MLKKYWSRIRLAFTLVRLRSLFRRPMSSSLPFGSRRKSARVNAKSLLGVLSLGIVGGVTIRIIADGADEEQAVDALVELVNSGFAE